MATYDLHSESDNEYMGRRKGRKVLSEKRRRARINQCLDEIKHIVCGSQKHTESVHEKMEKAEILESTVNYLRNVRKITTTPQQVKETVKVRFQQGYSRCAEEILTYIQSLPGVSDNVQHQLRKHLNGRLTYTQQVPVTSSTPDMMPHSSQWYQRLHPVQSQDPHSSAHAYINSSVCTSPVRREVNLEDSGYGVSPDSKELLKYDSVMESERGRVEIRDSIQIVTDSRISAWVQSTLSYSQQIKMQQQAPWRPW